MARNGDEELRTTDREGWCPVPPRGAGKAGKYLMGLFSTDEIRMGLEFAVIILLQNMIILDVLV